MAKKSVLAKLIEAIRPRRVTAGNPYHKGAGPGGGQFTSGGSGNGGKGINADLARDEQTLIDNPGRNEIVAIYNPEGRRMFVKTSDEKRQVSNSTWNDDERAMAKNGVMLHNHPDDLSFSEGDIRYGVGLGVRQIKVISPSYTYILQPKPGREWPDRGELISSMWKHQRVQANEVIDKISKGKYKMLADENHPLMLELAKQWSLDYRKIRRK